MKTKELAICGLAAVRARFGRDARSIHRLYFDYPTGRQIGVMCKALAAAKKIYRCVEPAELEKIAGSVHHGGIVAVVDAPVLRAPSAAEVRAWAARGEPLLLLDRIGNAHNLGAIARTAAFFGVAALIVPEHPAAALPNDAAFRVAEGGLEHVTVFRVKDLAEFSRELAASGYAVVGAAAHGGQPERPKEGKDEHGPIALVLGNEERGLTPDVAAACTRRVTIPGCGRVESLNVSAAAAVLMWELFARRTGLSKMHEARLR
ncbi:MAG TPA: RNA methyltransferase [Opitutaceae bacterium]|nr:RNA methyltransferase [Opitutaceae bacterium]